VAVSSDGKRIATGCDDKAAYVWDADGHLITGPMQHRGPVIAVAFSPDGTRVASGSEDKTARLWDAATGKAVGAPLEHKDRVWAVAFHPTGKILATASLDRTVRLWAVPSGAPLCQPLVHGEPLCTLRFSADGKEVWTVDQRSSFRAWDVLSGKPLREGTPPREPTETAVVSANGQSYVTLHGSAARQRKASTGEPFGPTCATRWISQWFARDRSFALSADGTTLAVGDGREHLVRLWDLATGNQLEPAIWHPSRIFALAFGPDDQTLVTGCQDQQARLWRRVAQPAARRVIPGLALFLAADRFLVVNCNSGEVTIRDLSKGQTLGTMQVGPGVRSYSVSADLQHLLVCREDNSLTRWRFSDGRQIGKPVRLDFRIKFGIYHPNGQTIAVISDLPQVALVDAASGQRIEPEAFRHGSQCNSVHFSPDGTRMVVACSDFHVYLWDWQTRKRIEPVLKHESHVRVAGFGPDGKTILTAGDDRTARLWDAQTGKPLCQPLRHQDLVFAVALHPNGKTALTGGLDNTLRLWDVRTGQPIGLPLRQADYITYGQFAPDGRAFLAGGREQQTYVYSYPPAATGSAGDLKRLAERMTGMAIDPSGTVVRLRPEEWRARK
jgi:WD40 repeat protein